MPRALVTGGRGFIGRAIARSLGSAGYDLTTLDPGTGEGEVGGRHFTGSVVNPHDVQRAASGADVVFHLAGILGTTELLSRNRESVEVNVIGTINALEASLRHSASRFFYPTKPNCWLNTYSITKSAGEAFAQLYADRGLEVRILRWLNAYGPGQSVAPIRKAVPVMILQAFHGREIEVFGSGEQKVHLIHVDDLAATTVAYTLAEGGTSTVRDTGQSVEMTVNELAETIRVMTKSKARIVHLPMRAGEDPDHAIEPLPGPTAADLVDRAGSATPIESGMAETIEHYSKLPTGECETALAFHRSQWQAGTAM